MRRFVPILLYLLFLPLTASAQLLQPVYSAPSPQAGSLGEYGEVPVSHFTGTPDVHVPLFEIEAGDYKYPVGLSYHLSSVKPNLQPGPVGLGWLLTDACISRTVRGVYDEKQSDGVNGVEHGYYGHRSKMKNIGNSQFDQYTQESLTGDDWFELSADEFSFNVNGHSGLFYLNPDGEWTVVSDEDIAVEFDPDTGFLDWQDINARFWGKVQHWTNRSENARWFKGFTLITPDGIRYEFGGLNAIDFSVPYYGRGNGDLVATAWHLARITTPRGYEITFEYSTNQILCDLHYTPGRVVSYGFNASDASYLNREIRGRSALSGFLIYPAALTGIIGPAGTIEVSYRQNERYNSSYRGYYPDALYWENPDIRSENMYHYSLGDPSVQFFELLPVSDTGNMKENQRIIAECFRHDIVHRVSYSPENGDSALSWYCEYVPGCRPFLSSIRCREGYSDVTYHEVEGGGVVYLIPEYETPVDSSSTAMPEWDFRYYWDRELPDSFLLPDTDAWGYWKGCTVSLSASYYHRSESPAALLFARSGALKEVYYPTGGSTLFEYESNDYGKTEKADHSGVENRSGVSGGLRISRLTEMDRSGRIHRIKKFHYKDAVNATASSGIATRLPSDTQVYVYRPNQYVVVESSEGFPAVSTNRNTPPVGYSSVIEETQDAGENTLGFIRYRFSNFDADLFGTPHLDEQYLHNYNGGNTLVGIPFTSNSSERGKLQSKEWYDSGYNLVRKETTRYSRITNGSFIVADQRMAILCQDPAFFRSAHIGWLTQTRTYSYLPVETVITEYPSDGTSVQTTSTMSYNASKLVDQTASSRSDGTSLQKVYTYAGDYSAYDWMSSRHILDAPVTIQTTVNSMSRTEEARYSAVQNMSGILVPFMDRLTVTRSGSDDPKVMYEVLSADPWGNPNEIVAGGMRSRLYWGYDGQRLLSVADNVSANRGSKSGAGLRVAPDYGIDITGPFNGVLGRDFFYDGDLRPALIAGPNYLATRYGYDLLGRLIATFESDASDGWGTSRMLTGNNYCYAGRLLRSSGYSSTSTSPSPPLPEPSEGDEPIQSESVTLGYTTSLSLEYRSSDYHSTHPSNRGMIAVRDTSTIRFRVSGFSYYHDSGDSLSLDGTLLDVQLFRHRISSDSLVAVLPLCVDSHTLEQVAWPDPNDTTATTLQLPPGLYEVVFGGISSVVYADVGEEEPNRGGIYGNKTTSRKEGGLRDEVDPEDPDPDEPELEELSHFPSFVLEMDCLPLIEPEPEPEPASSPPVIKSWNSVWQGESRDGTEGNMSVTVYWLDDFGHKEVSVAAGANPEGKDLASLVERDGWGREIKDWLPVVSLDSLTIVHPGADSVKTLAGVTYGNSEKPYSLTEYEQSALSRVTGQFGPGAAWQNSGKKVSTAYLTNTASGAELSCRRFVCTSSNNGTSWTVTSPGNYADGKLYVTRTTDEDGRQAWEFKDFDGNVVLSRARLAANQYLDTYYVYDGLGNLQAVLPPLASASITGGAIPQDALAKYAYLYTYDDRDRCIVKKLPGAEPVYYVYDEADRTVLTQDGNSRGRGEAVFTLYDVFGRVVLTGTCWNTITPGDRLRTYAKATYVGSSGVLKGYDVEGITLVSPTVLTASWYDTHSFTDDVLELTLSGSDTTLVFGTPAPVSYGLQTGSWAALLGDGDADAPEGTWSVIRYDRRNRVAKTVSSTHTGGRTIEDVEYSFRGSPLKRHVVHTDSPGYSFSEDYASTFDHEERLLTQKHSLNGADSVAVVSNTYDSLGRLASNGRTGNSQLTTQYAYNIRSWTTGISSPYFSETLYYNTARPGSSSAVQWGGNVSSMAWDTTKAYDYTYDGLSRLTGAVYAGNTSNSRQYSYDAHGNITGLTEGTTPHTYMYTGNHLSGSQYDNNGNTTSDSGSEIVAARYNVLNLPEEIIKFNGDTVRYVYSAAGTKLCERVIPQLPSGTTTRTDYVGNLVYRNGLLGRILVGGGSVVAKDSTLPPTYEFSFTDHLGSIRALVADGDSLYRKTEYGPYGEVLSEEGASQPGSPGGGGGDDGGGVIEVGDDEEEPGGRGTRSVGIIQTYVYNPYRFGGKERLDVGGLDMYDFGARHYTPALPRWLTMDPLAEKYFSISPYVYCISNPVNHTDPDGCDGIYITFPKYKADGYPYTGHAGVLLINNKTGYTKYYEYGRYKNVKKGLVRTYAVPDVVMENGMPTAESLNRVLSKISNKSGKGEVLEGAYINSDNFDAMNNYAKKKYDENKDERRTPYSIMTNNCGTFAHDVIKQDETVDTPIIIDPRPVSIIDEYQEKFTPISYDPQKGTTIKSKEQTTVYNNQTKTTEVKQNWWQKLWYHVDD